MPKKPYHDQKFTPAKPADIGREVNDIVDNHIRYFGTPFDTDDSLPVLEPRIELSDTDEAVTVSAELPGIDPQEIEVSVSREGYLTISGEKKNKTEFKNKGYYFSERSYGLVERTVSLPPMIDPDKTEAEFEKGVLKIVIPKLPEENKKTKKVEIKSK